MRRLHLAFVTFLLLLLCGAAIAEEAEMPAETPMVAYSKKFSVPADSVYVDFGDLIVTDWNAFDRFLKALPNLEKCDMFTTVISRAKAEELAEAWPDIEFGWTMRIGSAGCIHYIRTDTEVFSTFHHSGANGHTEYSLKVLRFCKHLKALDIGHNRVADLSWISELTELRVLILAINDVTDLSPLANLTELEYLEMFRTNVTDLSPLAGLKKLKDLNISYNNITDLSPLYGLKQLERLWVFNSMPVGTFGPIHAEEEAALREALPNTYIDNESTPTDGGWRTHPRYKIISEMFFEGGSKYIPFDEETSDN